MIELEGPEKGREVRKGKFYVTTAIDYVNAPPHLGHLYEKLCADVLARFHRLKGEDVFFLTGTDENASKNEKAAKEAGISVKEFVDRNAQKFIELCRVFNISNDDFIRTTEERHKRVAQLVFKKLFDKGDIYKGVYEGFYCVGCEEFKTKKDLVDGKCPEHGEVEWIKEENYFFRASKYEEQILELIEKGNFIIPKRWRNEILQRLRENGLKDISISRKGVGWGIVTPIDKEHRIYVWIDALVNYISALGYPDGELYKKFWPADVHLIGKGVNWFHSVIWPALLLALGVELPKVILVHGYITLEGEKLSKSKGKVVDPFELAQKYQIDAIRYYLLKEVPFGGDGDFSEKRLVEKVNNELVANLGNFIHRTLSFVWKEFDGEVPKPEGFDEKDEEFITLFKEVEEKVGRKLENFEIDEAFKGVLEFSSSCNQYFQNKEPWRTKDKNCIYLCVNAVRSLAILMEPFLPSSAEKVWKILNLSGSVHEQEWSSISELSFRGGEKIRKPEIIFKKILKE